MRGFLLGLVVLWGCAPGDDSEVQVTLGQAAESDAIVLAVRDVRDFAVPDVSVETRRVIESSVEFVEVFGAEPPASVDFTREWLFFYAAGGDAVAARVDYARYIHTADTLVFGTTRERLGPACPRVAPPAVLVAFTVPDVAPRHLHAEHVNEDRLCAPPPACTGSCDDGLTCVGIPDDGSSPEGSCRDLRELPDGLGDPCITKAGCGQALVCAGLSRGDEGTCVAGWMAARFPAEDLDLALAGGASHGIIVQGQASVPVDVWLSLDLEEAEDLRVVLHAPSGELAEVWTPGAGVLPERLAVPFGGDTLVNGRWTVEVSGSAGRLRAWAIEVTSRWD